MGYMVVIVVMDVVLVLLYVFDIVVVWFLYVVVGILCGVLFEMVFVLGVLLKDVCMWFVCYFDCVVVVGVGVLCCELNDVVVYWLFVDVFEFDMVVEYVVVGVLLVCNMIGYLCVVVFGVFVV